MANDKTLNDIYSALQVINSNMGSFRAEQHADQLATQQLIKKLTDEESAISEGNGLNIGLGEDGKLSASVHAEF